MAGAHPPLVSRVDPSGPSAFLHFKHELNGIAPIAARAAIIAIISFVGFYEMSTTDLSRPKSVTNACSASRLAEALAAISLDPLLCSDKRERRILNKHRRISEGVNI
jgi:hypothetical protein